LFLFGGAACADLEVVNQNSADAERALATAGDVESLIAGSFNSWFSGTHSYLSPGPIMSNQAFQHTAPWANFGMEFYGRLPRNAVQNNVADSYYSYINRPWTFSYRAIAALADGMKALDNPDIADELGPEAVANLRAYAKFVQALSHATVALFYDRGFLVTEDTDLAEAQEPMTYNELMTAALGMFDEAIALASAGNIDIPAAWMSREISGQELARVAHSLKARFRAQVARTAADRQAVDWGQVIADVDAGVTDDFTMYFDWNNGWYYSALDYSTDAGWSQLNYFVYGMADQEGDYQRWVALTHTEKSYEFAGGEPVLIVTPDLRFPRGSTVEEQRAAGGTYYRITTAGEAGGVWAQPGRGTWRWSWYKTGPKGEDYWVETNWDQPVITLAEMRLLKAEGLFSTDKGAAAAIINETRTASGLNATDANGTNTSCVPKLPNGNCGDLWEMLKWEKRMETVWTGVAMGNWFFDGRGWGDLYVNTPLQYPVPCQELQVLQLLPCNTYGGPGGEFSAPGSTYAYPHET
jgi:hypothetical protein